MTDELKSPYKAGFWMDYAWHVRQHLQSDYNEKQIKLVMKGYHNRTPHAEMASQVENVE